MTHSGELRMLAHAARYRVDEAVLRDRRHLRELRATREVERAVASRRGPEHETAHPVSPRGHPPAA